MQDPVGPAPSYGQQPAHPYGYGSPAADALGQGLATASLVCGILAAVFGLIPFTWFIAVVLGILAIVFGAVARRRAASGQATAGLVLGIVAVALTIFWVIFWLVLLP